MCPVSMCYKMATHIIDLTTADAKTQKAVNDININLNDNYRLHLITA